MSVFGNTTTSTPYGTPNTEDNLDCYSRENIKVTMKYTVYLTLPDPAASSKGRLPRVQKLQYDMEGSGSVLQFRECKPKGLSPTCGPAGIRVENTRRERISKILFRVNFDLVIDIDQENCKCRPCQEWVPDTSEPCEGSELFHFTVPKKAYKFDTRSSIAPIHPDIFRHADGRVVAGYAGNWGPLGGVYGVGGIDKRGQLCWKGGTGHGFGALFRNFKMEEFTCEALNQSLRRIDTGSIPFLCCVNTCEKCLDMVDELREQGRVNCPVPQ